MTRRVTRPAAPDPWQRAIERATDARDVALELELLGAVVQAPAPALVTELGADTSLFSTPTTRALWSAVSVVLADGGALTIGSLRAQLEADDTWGRDVHAADLARLWDACPRLTEAVGRSHVVRLATLRDARRFAYAVGHALEDVRRDPTTLEAALAQLTDATTPPAAALPLLDDVELAQRPVPPMLVTHRLPRKALAGLIAAPGLGKTTLALDLALSVATRTPWLGALVLHQGPAVYIAAEGAGGFPARVRAWKLAHGWPLDTRAGLHVWTEPVNLLEPAEVRRLLAGTRRLAPVLVIVDTLARAMAGGDENSTADMGRLIAGADRVRRELAATVLLVHHTDKNAARERGSSALRGAADTLWQLSEVDDLLELTCTKQKDAPPFDAIRLHRVEAHGSIRIVMGTDAIPRDTLSPAQEAARAKLRECFGTKGATLAQWRDVCALPPATFYRAAKVLQDRGLVLERGGVLLAAATPDEAAA